MRIHFLFLILFSFSIALEANSINNLRINHLAAPLGIDITENNFSFQTEEEGPFTASILLNNEVYDTKEIKLENCHSFTFEKDLEYNKVYKFVVESSTSKAELEFETAIKLEASFIRPKNKDIFSPIFIKEFNLENKSIKKARIYITGLGLYQAFLNDKKVGNSYLTPGYNDYDHYLRYQTYDITDLLQEKNTIEVHMGDGWYKGRFGITTADGKNQEIFGSEYKLCAHIIVEFQDGKTQEIKTDDSWKVKHSQEISNSIYDGEEVDFTLVNNTVEGVDIRKENYPLTPDFGSHIVQKDSLIPVLYISPKGEKILDFKQNMVGFVRFNGTLKKNQVLTMKHGEVLQNKTFYNDNYRSAKALLSYKGDGKQRIYEPKFTFFGFRYVLVEGLDKVDPKNFEGVVIYTDLEKTIECETDNKKINKLIKNSFWGQRGNFLDVPTDCPQRDERLGWTGDSQVFSNTACYNMDSYNFYRKHLKDLKVDQDNYYEGDFPMVSPSLKKQLGAGGAVWADVGTIIPWNLYMNYGDKELLERNYQMMTKYVETLIQKDKDQGNKHLILEGFTFGDWLALDGVTEQSTMGGTDLDYIMSIYYYVSVNNVLKAAKELGKGEEEIEKYETLKNQIYDAILEQYFTPNGKLSVNTQTGYILSLYYKIYRDKEVVLKDYRKKLSKDVYKLKTGFTGTPLTLLALFDNGLDSDAYRFLYNEKFPGWLYAINLGATTIWERWNSLLEDGSISGTSMNSLNHYSYGSVCEAIYSRIAGLKNLSPGWKKVLIQPHLNYRMGKMNFSYNSISGKYEISWKYDETKFYINVTIPNGAEAQIILPDGTDYNVTKGNYHYECKLDEYVHAPYSIDTPLFEILENKEGEEVVKEVIPSIYYFALPDNIETLYSTIRDYINQPFFGITEEQAKKCQEELSKIKVPPIDDSEEDIEPSDEPDNDNDSSNFIKLSTLLLSLIILF